MLCPAPREVLLHPATVPSACHGPRHLTREILILRPQTGGSFSFPSFFLPAQTQPQTPPSPLTLWSQHLTPWSSPSPTTKASEKGKPRRSGCQLEDTRAIRLAWLLQEAARLCDVAFGWLLPLAISALAALHQRGDGCPEVGLKDTEPHAAHLLHRAFPPLCRPSLTSHVQKGGKKDGGRQQKGVGCRAVTRSRLGVPRTLCTHTLTTMGAWAPLATETPTPRHRSGDDR